MYKLDLALNNLQGLICHKTQPTNQTNNPLQWDVVLAWCYPSTTSRTYLNSQKYQLRFHLSLNKCFSLLLWHYVQVST